MNTDKIRYYLNVIFIILAVAAVIVYFVCKDNYSMFLYVAGAAIFFKLIEIFLRFTNR